MTASPASTFVDLKAHRAHVIRTLRASGLDVDPMEEWTSDSDEPRVFSTKRVEGCDLCILLVAFLGARFQPGLPIAGEAGAEEMTPPRTACRARAVTRKPALHFRRAPW